MRSLRKFLRSGQSSRLLLHIATLSLSIPSNDIHWQFSYTLIHCNRIFLFSFAHKERNCIPSNFINFYHKIRLFVRNSSLYSASESSSGPIRLPLNNSSTCSLLTSKPTLLSDRTSLPGICEGKKSEYDFELFGTSQAYVQL